MRRLSILAIWLALVLVPAGHAQTLTSFGFNAAPLIGQHPVLVLLPNYPGLPTLGTFLQWQQLVFDDVTSISPPRYSIANWASENSNGRLTLTPANPLPIVLNMNAEDSFAAIQAANPGFNEAQTNNLWIARVVQAAIDGGFNFHAFDGNHDGTVQCPEELTILVVNPAATAATGDNGGVNRNMATVRDDTGGVFVSGASIIAGHRAPFDTIIHEFGHSFGIGYEMYTFPPGGGAVNEGMSIMSTSGVGSPGANLVFSDTWNPARLHFDPFHKLRFGWAEPRIVSLRQGGRYVLPVATSRTVNAPVILYDPLRGTQEYFILEYRSRSQSTATYDSNFAFDQHTDREGLVIWQVATQGDHSVFTNWTPGDPALNTGVPYSSSIVCRCSPGLNVTANRPWISGEETQSLKWFDGSDTSAQIHVLPFAPGATSITVEILADYETWVDFNYTGLPFFQETGDFNTPYNSIAEGVANTGYGGRMRIKAGQSTAIISNVDKPMTIEAFGGVVTIGHFP